MPLGSPRLVAATLHGTLLVETAEEIKAEFNDVPLQQLIDYVYTEYPEYAENSVL